jgi:hypothetical protein
LIAFASYVEDHVDFKGAFFDWLKVRDPDCLHDNLLNSLGKSRNLEVKQLYIFLVYKHDSQQFSQLLYLRNAPRSKVLTPVNDLSALSGRDMGKLVSGAKIMGDEYASYVIHNRKGVVLRSE